MYFFKILISPPPTLRMSSTNKGTSKSLFQMGEASTGTRASSSANQACIFYWNSLTKACFLDEEFLSNLIRWI
jgi:hypothetical protein